MPAPALNDFLTQNVEGYLLGDIKSMSGPQSAGGCGYPLLMTVCSGIELLGALSSYLQQAFATHGMGDKYFLNYWKDALYPNDSDLRDAGEVVYRLARHGLAHSFLTKGDLLVVNKVGEPHFKHTPLGVVINANELATDFTRSYRDEFVTKRLRANRQGIERRLGEMWNEYTSQANKLWHRFAPLPSSPPAAMASGTAITATPTTSLSSGASGPPIITSAVSKFGS